MDEYRGGRDDRKACPICQRKFIPESFEKHKLACQRNAKAKRKVFDSTKQRTMGTDISYKAAKQAQKKAAQEKKVAPPKSNWRAQHQDFINTVRAARGAQVAMERGDPLPPPPPPSQNLDYVQCPYCSRRFNQKAAERHIGFCKEQQQRLPGKRQPTEAEKARAAARKQYQAPKLKGRSGYAGESEAPAAASPGYGSRGGPPPSQGYSGASSGYAGKGATTQGYAGRGQPASRTPASTNPGRPGMSRTSGAANGYAGSTGSTGRAPPAAATRGRPAPSNPSTYQGRYARR